MSFSFDGVDDMMTVSPGVLNNEQVTFFVTCYPTTYGELARGHFFAHGPGVEVVSRYAFYLDDNTSGSFQALSFAVSRGADQRFRANYAVALNVWQSAAVTYDGALLTNVPIFYKNGGVVASATVTAGAGVMNVDEPQPFYLGNASATARTFAGWIGVLAMWNRLLHPSEVALVHHCGVRKVLRGLQLWYRGTNGGGTPDWTGQGRTLTVTGALNDNGADGDRLAAS